MTTMYLFKNSTNHISIYLYIHIYIYIIIFTCPVVPHFCVVSVFCYFIPLMLRITYYLRIIMKLKIIKLLTLIQSDSSFNSLFFSLQDKLHFKQKSFNELRRSIDFAHQILMKDCILCTM